MIALERMRTIDWTTRKARLLLILSATCAVLLGLVVNEIAAPIGPEDDMPASEVAAAPRADAPVPPIATLPPLESLSEVVARPIFSPSRHPSAGAEADGTSGEVEDLVLEGIVVVAQERIALIRHGNPAITARIKEGQTIDGWTVRSVTPDRILIENAGVAHELRLGRKSRQGTG